MSLLDDILRKLGVLEEEIPRGSYLASRSQQVVAALPFPLVVCDKRLQILGASPAFGRLFRLSQAELGGKTLAGILGSDVRIIDGRRERPLMKGWPEIALQRNPKILAGRFPRVGERTFHLFTRRIPPHLLVVFQDVTDETGLKGKIEKSRSELLSIFDGVEDPMVMIDRGFRIRRVNEAMLKTVGGGGGTSYQNFIGRACYLKLHGRPERCPGCVADRTFATGKKTSRLGLLERRPQPDEFTYQITAYPLKDSSGAVTGIAESYRDVTEIQRTEEELYESERSRIMEPLAAGIAHEVRNPLAIIRSTSQYCLGELGDNHRDLRESLRTILRNTEQANRVIGNLLDFARPNQTDFRRQPIKPLIQKALALVRARADFQKVRLVRRVSDSLPPLVLDGSRFIQAMMNFFVNALDAMPQGGRLEVAAERRNGDRMIVVTVRDSGKGIPEELLPRILQPFYSTKKEGIGLGLPIAEGIIRSHGGRVHFKSCVGKGTEVRMKLPLNPKIRRVAA